MEEFITLDFDEILEKQVPNEEVEKEVEEIQEEELEEVQEVEELEQEDDEQPVEVDQIKELYKVVSSVLPIDENEEPTTEWLEEQVNDIPRKLLEVAITSMPQDAQTVLGYVANKSDFTMKDLVDYVNQFAKDDVEVDSVEGARLYLKSNPQFIKLYDEDELDEELDRLEDNDKLVAKAKKLKEADDALKNQQAVELTNKTKEEQQQTIIRQKEFVKEIGTQVDSLGWKEDAKRQVFENLKQERVQFVNSKLKENPKAIVQMAHIYSYFDEKTGFDKLFEVLEGKEKSKKVLEEKDKLQRSKLSGLVKTVTPPKKETKGWVPTI